MATFSSEDENNPFRKRCIILMSKVLKLAIMAELSEFNTKMAHEGLDEACEVLDIYDAEMQFSEPKEPLSLDEFFKGLDDEEVGLN